jgi:hypothetical protein
MKKDYIAFQLKKYAKILLPLNVIIFWTSFVVLPWYITLCYFIFFGYIMIISITDTKRLETNISRKQKLNKLKIKINESNLY